MSGAAEGYLLDIGMDVLGMRSNGDTFPPEEVHALSANLATWEAEIHERLPMKITSGLRLPVPMRS